MKPDLSPYLRHEQQVEFNMLAPFLQSRIRVIRLRRKGNAPLGFSIRGGYEHGTGVFISEVQPNSEAHRQGLRVGDQILRINGFNIDQAIHEDVLNLLKTKPGVVLKVKSVGMIPVKDKKKDPLTWKVVDSGGGGSTGHSPADSIVDGSNSYSGSSNYEEFQEAQVTLNIIGASGIGLTIVKGPPETPGIFVQTVKPNSLAECAGLQVGDQIIDMNGTSFLEIDFNQAVSLMKSTKELRLCLRKGAGLDLFPEEKSRRAAAMLNGASHTTKDDRRQLPILSEEEERHTNGPSGRPNGVIIAEIIQHPPPPSAQDATAEGHQRQASAATTATLSERDVSISETNVPYTLEPQTNPASTSSIISENSSPLSTLSLESIENGHSDVEKVSTESNTVLEKRPPAEAEEMSRTLKREEEWLAEERRKLEAEQARLKEEAEKLAQERRELEEERRLRTEASIPVPPPTPPLSFLSELQNKQPLTPNRARLRPMSMDGTKYQEEIVKRKQHEQLMQEFQKMHKKMFGKEEKPPTIEEKEPPPEPKSEELALNFNRRQQVSEAPKPPPLGTGLVTSGIVSRAISQPNLRQSEDTSDGPAEHKSTGDSTKNENETPQSVSGLASETKRSTLVASKPVLPVAVTSVTSSTTTSSINSSSANSNNTSTKESFTLPNASIPEVPDMVPGNLQASAQAATTGSQTRTRRSKDFPITDSRGPIPKPPQTYFEPKPQKGKGPLVTIGVYPDNSRHNRFSSLTSEGVRNRQNQFESRSSSPSSSAPISVSVTSSSASSSATSSPHPPERKLVNGQQSQNSQGQGANPPVSFKVTYNSKTNASVNSITVNKSSSNQGSQNSLTLSLNGKPAPTATKTNTPNTTSTAPGSTATTTMSTVAKNPKDLLSPEDVAGREIKVLTIPKSGPLNMKVSGGSGQPESGGGILVSELWEGGCIGPKVDIRKGDQIMMVGEKSLVNIKLTQANVILREAMSSGKEPLKLVIARENK